MREALVVALDLTDKAVRSSPTALIMELKALSGGDGLFRSETTNKEEI